MLKCDKCSEEYVFRVHSVGNGEFACDKCWNAPMIMVSVADINKSVTLNLGNGQKMKTTKAEINEVRRLRVLPYEKPGGGWYGGRMGENGKIQERPVKN